MTTTVSLVVSSSLSWSKIHYILRMSGRWRNCSLTLQGGARFQVGGSLDALPLVGSDKILRLQYESPVLLPLLGRHELSQLKSQMQHFLSGPGGGQTRAKRV